MVRLRLVLLGLLPALLWGCGGGEAPGEPLSVSGTIQHQGQPLADATVQYFAMTELPAEYRYVSGTTDANGKYTLPEVYPATYQVSVLPAGNTAGTEEHAANPAPPALAKYGPESPLQAEVTPTQTTFDFNLE